MGWVQRLAYTVAGVNGTRVRKRTRDWWIGWTDSAGTPRRKKIGRDKRAAEGALARVQELVARERAGLPADPAAGDAVRPLTELAAEYLAGLAAAGTSARYRRTIDRHLTAVMVACRWLTWADVGPRPLLAYLGGLRGDGKAPATVNGHLRSVRGFVLWLADALNAANPIRKVKFLNEDVDRRRGRTQLTDAELARLVAAAAASPYRYKCLVNGKARAVVYQLAAYSGLRASELESLTPARFDLDADTPLVTIEAADAKGKRLEPVPLPRHLVPMLREFLAGRPRGGRLFPGNWARHKRQGLWLARDLKRAGIGTTSKKGRQLDADGKPYNFHSLRRRYVTRLIRSGADVDQVRRLARHRDVRTTLKYYADSGLAELGAAADKLAPLPAVPAPAPSPRRS